MSDNLSDCDCKLNSETGERFMVVCRVHDKFPSDNLNKVEELLEEYFVMRAARPTDDLAILKLRNEAGSAEQELAQALLQLINNEKIAWEQKPVGDAIEIDVPAKTMQFVMSKIKLKPKTIASRTLTPEWVVELWLNGKGDKYDLQVYIWKLKILASLTHRYNWAIFLLKPENLPTKATLKKGEK